MGFGALQYPRGDMRVLGTAPYTRLEGVWRFGRPATTMAVRRPRAPVRRAGCGPLLEKCTRYWKPVMMAGGVAVSPGLRRQGMVGMLGCLSIYTMAPL